MNPGAYSKSRHKLQCLKEEHIDSNTAWISVLESCLEPHIKDAQVNIPNYQIHRQDRRIRDRGGVLLYVHDSLPTSNVETFDDSYCGAVLCYIKSIDAIVISVYRPPNAPVSSFEKLLKFTQKYISDISNKVINQCDVYIMGDFNLPNICWTVSDSYGDHSKLSESATLLTNFMEENFLCQCVDKPTRGNNILDIFF